MNIRKQTIDKTHLSVEKALERGFLHRDYLAHCLRWSHVLKHLKQGLRYKTAHILDIGCGRDVPLARAMFSGRLVPETGSYTGVDYNKLEMPAMFLNARWKPTLMGQQIFPKIEGLRESYDLITCFEVLEHVEPLHAFKMLQGMRKLLSADGTAFISTPNFDPQVGAADNHVSEMAHATTGRLIEKAGLGIRKMWGTFASIKDYKDQLKEYGLEKAFEDLREYYDSNVLAVLFAPLFPEQARNCLWELCPTPTTHFAALQESQVLGSSTMWHEFFKEESGG